MGTAPQGWQTPKTNWLTSDPVGNGDLNRIEQNIKSIELENRTIDDAQAPSSDTGSLRNFLDWLANRIKAIIGKTNWYDAPSISLEGAYNHKQNTSNPHQVSLIQAANEGGTLDDIPEGTTNKHLTNGNQTIAGNKTFSGKIIDKNGNEVIAMLMETKGNTSGGSVGAKSEVNVDVTGFSWTPTGILVAQVAWGTASDFLTNAACFPAGTQGEGSGAGSGHMSIVSLTPGANKVTVRIRNSGNSTYYYDNVIVTAVKA
jgi:hypothetical protein